MISEEELERLISFSIDWTRKQEAYILANGIPLSEDQQIDAHQIGVKDISKIRLWKGPQYPIPLTNRLKTYSPFAFLVEANLISACYGHGIYIHQDYWLDKRIIVHELTHTMQYERLGSTANFVRHYLEDFFHSGYLNISLEKEAKKVEETFFKSA